MVVTTDRAWHLFKAQTTEYNSIKDDALKAVCGILHTGRELLIRTRLIRSST